MRYGSLRQRLFASAMVVWLGGSATPLMAQQGARTPSRFGIDLGVAAGLPDADSWMVEGRSSWGIGSKERRVVLTLAVGTFSPPGLIGTTVADSLGFIRDARRSLGRLAIGLEQTLLGTDGHASVFGRVSAAATLYDGQPQQYDGTVVPPRFAPPVGRRLAPGGEAAVGIRFPGRIIRPRVELRLAADYYRGAGIIAFPVAAAALELRRDR